MSKPPGPYRDGPPDVRDGLTRVERVVLLELVELRRELGRESVPLVMLYGRVLESIDLSEAELRAALARLGASVGPVSTGHG